MAPSTLSKAAPQEKVPDKFLEAMARYNAARKEHNVLKMEVFESIPQTTPSEDTNSIKHKSWWHEEADKSLNSVFPPVDLMIRNHSGEATTIDTVRQDLVQQSLGAKVGASGPAATEESSYMDKFAKAMCAASFAPGLGKPNRSAVELDEATFVAKITGEEGLVVPAELDLS